MSDGVVGALGSCRIRRPVTGVVVVVAVGGVVEEPGVVVLMMTSTCVSNYEELGLKCGRCR